MKNYSIKRKNKYLDISKPPKIDFFEHNQTIYNKKFDKYIYNFILTISQNPNIDLNLFYENLKTLKIYKIRNFKESFFKKSNIRARYLIDKNEILVMNNDDFYYIYHELLHCASTKRFNDKLVCGFNTIYSNDLEDYKNIKGTGLNEGYTQLLTNRYFNHICHKKKIVYPVETLVAEILEKIIDDGMLEKFYFNADLTSLVDYLSEFVEVKEINKFLYCLDTINKNGAKEIASLEKMYKFIGYFLVKAYTIKLLILAKNKKITKEQFMKLTDEFENKLTTTTVNYKKNQYIFLTDQEIEQQFNNLMDDPKIKKIRLS